MVKKRSKAKGKILFHSEQDPCGAPPCAGWGWGDWGGVVLEGVSSHGACSISLSGVTFSLSSTQAHVVVNGGS